MLLFNAAQYIQIKIKKTFKYDRNNVTRNIESDL